MKYSSYLCLLSLALGLGSCQKEAMKEAATEQGQKIWYKGESYTVKTTLDKKGQFTTAYMPDELKAFYKDSTAETVTHLIVNEKETLMCFYDTEKEFQEHVTFESISTPNRPKGLNGARITTYANASSYDVYTAPNIAYTFTTVSGPIRTSTNDIWGTYHFNSHSGYGKSIPWVGDTENDNIEGMRFERFDDTPTQFMGSKHITWGGAKLWITNNTTMIKDLDLNRFGWGNIISSYEYFQADVATHGINF